MRKTSSGGRHPVRSLKRFAVGRATPAERRSVVRHLLAGCRSCGARLANLLTPRPADGGALTRVVDRAVTDFDRLEEQVGAELVAAEELIDRLRDLPAGRQRLMVANAERARQRAVCEELISESRAHRHDNAADTLRYAELAVLAAERYTGRDAEELRARALAERGNAQRILGDLRAAERDLGAAQRLLDQSCPDPLVLAELYSLRASLATYQRRFTVALRFLAKAASRYQKFDDLQGLARVLIQIGNTHSRRGEPRKGVGPVLRALKILKGVDDSRLRVIALQDLITLLAEAGESAEAAELIPRVRPVIEANGGRLDLLRFDWLTARVQRDLGRLDYAADLLLRVQLRFSDEDLPYEVALVSLDLAGIYAAEGRSADLRAVAAECTELFRALGVAREQMAALALLGRGEAESTVELITALQSAVEHARQALGRKLLPNS